ncbi:hypothetical protein MKX03_023250 [Papaver bracteatum]|nr:hypothetical protein MKX03_023250 [Papaver bracteatum]
MFTMTSIKGIGRRFANIICEKADVDMNERDGELSATELKNLMTIVAIPRQFKIPDWFLNRKKDYKDEDTHKLYLMLLTSISEMIWSILRSEHFGWGISLYLAFLIFNS